MMLSGHQPLLNILGVEIDIYADRQELMRDILERIGKGRREKVAFANANLVFNAQKNPHLISALADFIVVNDGLGVNMSSWILTRKRFPSNLNGTDFTPYLLENVPPAKIFLYGASEAVAKRAAVVLQEKFTQHKIVGWEHGYISAQASACLADQVKQSGADIILVALGNPRQELWLSENFERTDCQLGLAIGAYFDFVTDTVARAPAFMRASGTEWLFRLWQEPKRLVRRYTIEAVGLLLLVARQRMRAGKL